MAAFFLSQTPGKVKTLYKFILAGTIAWPALAMSLKSDAAAFRIVEYYIPDWIFGALVLRVVAAILFTIAILIALDRVNNVSKLLAAIVLLPVIDNLAWILGNDKFQTIFLFSNSTIESLLQTGILCLAFIGLVRRPSASFRKKWVYTVFIAMGIALSFIKPIYIDDWGTPLTSSPFTSDELYEFMGTHHPETSNEKPLLLAFFTTNCPFCSLTAVKLGISNRNEKLPQTVVIFPGTKEDAQEFLMNSGLEQVTYLLVDKDTFLHYAGSSFPSLYYTSERKAHHYTGSLFGYRALEHIAP